MAALADVVSPRHRVDGVFGALFTTWSQTPDLQPRNPGGVARDPLARGPALVACAWQSPDLAPRHGLGLLSLGRCHSQGQGAGA